MRVHDASNERKTADNLFKLMVEVIEELRSEWNVHSQRMHRESHERPEKCYLLVFHILYAQIVLQTRSDNFSYFID